MTIGDLVDLVVSGKIGDLLDLVICGWGCAVIGACLALAIWLLV